MPVVKTEFFFSHPSSPGPAYKTHALLGSALLKTLGTRASLLPPTAGSGREPRAHGLPQRSESTGTPTFSLGCESLLSSLSLSPGTGSSPGVLSQLSSSNIIIFKLSMAHSFIPSFVHSCVHSANAQIQHCVWVLHEVGPGDIAMGKRGPGRDPGRLEPRGQWAVGQVLGAAWPASPCGRLPGDRGADSVGDAGSHRGRLL